MGTKSLISNSFIALILFVLLLIPVHAEDDENNDNTNNLDLDTEILKNKKEDTKSTSTIGGYELFSTDYDQIIAEATKKENDHYYDLKTTVFIEEETNGSEIKKNDIDVFREEVKFDKMTTNNIESANYDWLLAISTVILLVSTFCFTKRKYSRHREGGEDNADNYHIHK